MNQDWEILGIEPTVDVAEIRRAYSKALRLHRPETDPVGFQRLREAYERRLEIAKSGGREGPSVVSFPSSESSSALDWIVPDPKPSSAPSSDGPAGGGRQETTSSPEIELDLPVSGSDATPDPDVSSDGDILLERWDALWADPFQRNDRRLWVQFLSGDAWWDWNARRCVERRILSDLESGWSHTGWRMVHDDAWYLMDRHFGWWKREQELSKRFSAGFIDELFSRIQQGGIRNGSLDYPSTPRTRTGRAASVPLPEHRPLGEESRSSTFGRNGYWWVFVLLSLVVRACYMISSDDDRPRSYAPVPSPLSVPSTFDSMVHPIVFPAMPEPVRQIRWDDETGGLLPHTCASTPDPSWGCPEEDRVQILLKGRKLERKMILVRGYVPLETLSLDLESDHWIRLCRQAGKDVVVLEKGPDPCSALPVKAWLYRKGRLKGIPATKPVCDTSTCNRYRDRTDWGPNDRR